MATTPTPGSALRPLTRDEYDPDASCKGRCTSIPRYQVTYTAVRGSGRRRGPTTVTERLCWRCVLVFSAEHHLPYPPQELDWATLDANTANVTFNLTPARRGGGR